MTASNIQVHKCEVTTKDRKPVERWFWFLFHSTSQWAMCQRTQVSLQIQASLWTGGMICQHAFSVCKTSVSDSKMKTQILTAQLTCHKLDQQMLKVSRQCKRSTPKHNYKNKGEAYRRAILTWLSSNASLDHESVESAESVVSVRLPDQQDAHWQKDENWQSVLGFVRTGHIESIKINNKCQWFVFPTHLPWEYCF